MNLEFSYNIEQADIRFPEYGRGIQELLFFAKDIEDREKRQKTVEAIVQMMQHLNPNRGNLDDYREKLWNHAFAIVDYDMDVVPPNGIQIRKESDKVRVSEMEYPDVGSRMRHYGHNIQRLIDKAIDMPDGPKKEGFVEVIASYMKLAYKTWNREHYVSDDVVKDDLEILSDGKLELHEGHSSLDILAASAGKRDLQRHNNQNNRNKKNNQNRKRGNYSNNNNNYRNKRKKSN
jgi:hypothetical protein